jgi:choline dehydrogenase-like flavoprotein
MLRNGRDIASGTELQTDVCVIGSGPAGITAAWELQKAGVKVILIEGSRPYPEYEQSWPDKFLLYNGEAVGLFDSNEPEFLVTPVDAHPGFPRERERVFGGTSTHWGGQSRPEDPVDLEPREGGFPGWPVTREDLDPFYAKASRLCHLDGEFDGGKNFSNEYWAKKLNAEPPVLPGFDVEMYQFVPPPYLNFAARTFDGDITIANSQADVILNASLLEIDHQGGRVTGLKVASMDTGLTPKKATEFTIKAGAYVLACGAVANARQLLLSGIGNDLVGRYFMCHALSSGQVVPQTSYLTPSEARFMAGQMATKKAKATQFTDGDGLRVNARFIPNRDMVRSNGIGRCWFWYQYGQYLFEVVPNPDSRVTLSDETDPVFGQRQTRIDWQLSPGDEKTYTTTTSTFQKLVKERGGTVNVTPWEWVKRSLVVNGHHMGTTRMSREATDGVVDADLKVHGLDNLYVAGSSVFPSAGISNPTFTIITLSIRLAHYLRGKFK